MIDIGFADHFPRCPLCHKDVKKKAVWHKHEAYHPECYKSYKKRAKDRPR